MDDPRERRGTGSPEVLIRSCNHPPYVSTACSNWPTWVMFDGDLYVAEGKLFAEHAPYGSMNSLKFGTTYDT